MVNDGDQQPPRNFEQEATESSLPPPAGARHGLTQPPTGTRRRRPVLLVTWLLAVAALVAAVITLRQDTVGSNHPPASAAPAYQADDARASDPGRITVERTTGGGSLFGLRLSTTSIELDAGGSSADVSIVLFGSSATEETSCLHSVSTEVYVGAAPDAPQITVTVSSGEATFVITPPRGAQPDTITVPAEVCPADPLSARLRADSPSTKPTNTPETISNRPPVYRGRFE